MRTLRYTVTTFLLVKVTSSTLWVIYENRKWSLHRLYYSRLSDIISGYIPFLITDHVRSAPLMRWTFLMLHFPLPDWQLSSMNLQGHPDAKLMRQRQNSWRLINVHFQCSMCVKCAWTRMKPLGSYLAVARTSPYYYNEDWSEYFQQHLVFISFSECHPAS